MTHSPRTLLLSEIFPPKTGGSGRWFWEIYRRMPKSQFTLAVGDDPHASDVDRTHDLDIVRLPLTLTDWGMASPSSFAAYWRAFWAVAQVVKDRGIERIHCGRCVPEGWMALGLKLLYGIPYDCYVHGEDANAASSGHADGVLSSRQLRFMTKLVLQNVDRVIANSHNSARIVREQWNVPANRVQLLHPGCDTNYFVPAQPSREIRDQLGWGGRPVIVTAGRLQKRKGQDTVIRALSTVRQAVPDVLFAIIGDGEERESLKALTVAEGQQEHVLFMGKVSDEVLKQSYQQADLFVLANRQIGTDIEGFGMVLLEAQACGTPVVAGASGGTAETMSQDETGYVVPCDEPNELAALLIQLLSNPARLDAMGKAARQWVETQFDWDVLAQQAAEMFGAPWSAPARRSLPLSAGSEARTAAGVSS